jgi:hypothetical protein
VLLNTVLESSLRGILHWGDADTILKMWEKMVSKAKWTTQAKPNSKKIFDYLNTALWWTMERNQQGLRYPLVWTALSLWGVLRSALPDSHCQDLFAANGS